MRDKARQCDAVPDDCRDRRVGVSPRANRATEPRNGFNECEDYRVSPQDP